MRKPGFETLCAHAGEDPARHLGAVAPPIYQNSLFCSPDAETFMDRGGRHPEVYDYTRVANPTTDILEAKLAALEGTEAARCFGSGMAAITAAILHCVAAGDHIVAVDTIYGPTRTFLSQYLGRFGVTVTFVPGTCVSHFAENLRENTRLIYLESPSSCVFRLQDLEAVAKLAREHGVTTIVDNSWASPYFQNPAERGIDLVVHSATKYLGGHSDIVAGTVTGARKHLVPIKQQEGSLLGGILDPFASWLMLRGLRTLPIRMERHQSNALAVARFLEDHPAVARVYYPGLPSHPQYALARRQMRGCSGLLSFALKDGSPEAVRRFMDRLRYFYMACSWGGFESLVAGLSFPGEDGEPARYGARLHVGLETVEDLLEDLEGALG